VFSYSAGVVYKFPQFKGWEIQYNNTISYDWDADSDDAWTVPLGLGVGKTMAFESGWGLNLVGGFYHNVVKPDGAADGMVRVRVSVILMTFERPLSVIVPQRWGCSLFIGLSV
jgi:hypothetical protein